MGGGVFDSSTYYSSATTRKAAGVDDFAYSKTSKTIHDSLKPTRIKDKAFKVLESRDSAEHPETTAIIVCFDVTGSNASRAVQAQKTLPGLMTLLEKYVADPQIAVAANDDFEYEPDRCFQMSEFESDNRIDEHIRNIKIVQNGGGNRAESYDLILFAALNKVATDCFEQRGKKGYLFMYADEPFFTVCSADAQEHVFGEKDAKDIPIQKLVADTKEKWEIFILFPAGSRYSDALQQYKDLFDDDHVIALQHPEMISEVIGATIGVCEGKTDSVSVIADLKSVGVDSTRAASVSASLVKLSQTRAVVSVCGGELEVGGSGAHRL